jgi:hypothetical protein
MDSTIPRAWRLATAASARRCALALLTLTLITLPRIGAAVPGTHRSAEELRL